MMGKKIVFIEVGGQMGKPNLNIIFMQEPTRDGSKNGMHPVVLSKLSGLTGVRNNMVKVGAKMEKYI
jgi:hypothetical protein